MLPVFRDPDGMNVGVSFGTGAEESRTGADPASRGHGEGFAKRREPPVIRPEQKGNISIADLKAEQQLRFFKRALRFLSTSPEKPDPAALKHNKGVS